MNNNNNDINQIRDTNTESIVPENNIITEKKNIKKLFFQPRILSTLHQIYNKLQNDSEILINAKNDQGKLLADAFAPFETLKLFSGLEIHNLQKAFSNFGPEITLNAFVIIGLRVLDAKPDISIFLLMSLIEIFDLLLRLNNEDDPFDKNLKGKPIITKVTFGLFLNLFMKNQILMAEKKEILASDDPSKKLYSNRIEYSKIQDVIHHDNPLRDAHYSEGLGYLFCLDDNSDHIRVYTINAILKFKIQPLKENHKHFPTFIINFSWAENKKIICTCLQDNKISFFESIDFSIESTFQTEKLQVKVWYLETLQRWIFNDTENQLSYWDQTKNKLVFIPFPKTEKISDILVLPTLNYIGVSTYDHRIVFLDPNSYFKVLSLPMLESSAHMMKYSKGFGLFMPVTFENIVKCYNIDSCKDFTKIGKFEHTCSITAIEPMDDYGVIITCDEQGCIKSWDPKTFKSIQHIQINSKHPVSKIIMLKKTNKFCALANRLHFFEFSQKRNQHLSKKAHFIPSIIYSPKYEILTIGTSFDIRSYNINYGVLTEIYSNELNGIRDKVKYIKYSKKQNWLCYSNRLGHITQILAVEKQHIKLEAFHPHPNSQLDGLIWYDRYELMITRSKNFLKVFKYELYNANNLIRQIQFPQNFVITEITFNKKKSVFFIVINYKYIMLIDFQKLVIIDCLIFPNLMNGRTSPKSKSSIDNEKKLVHNDMHSLRKDKINHKSSSKIEIPNIKIEKDDVSKIFISNQSTLRRSSNIDNPTPTTAISYINSPLEGDQSKKNLSNSSRFRHSSSLSNQQLNLIFHKEPKAKICENNDEDKYDKSQFCEISFIKYVKDWDCLIVIQDNSDIHLVKISDFNKFEYNLKLDLSKYSRITDDLIKIDYSCCKVKSILLSPEESIQDSMDIKDGKKTYNLLLLGSSDGFLTIINIQELLEKHFSYDDKEKVIQPYHKCDVIIIEDEMDKIIKKYVVSLSQQIPSEIIIPISENYHSNWKAHDSVIMNCKIIEHVYPLIVSIERNGILKIWNLKGELLALNSLNHPNLNKWNIMTKTQQHRLESVQKTKKFMQNLVEEFPEILRGYLVERKKSSRIFSSIEKNFPEFNIAKSYATNTLYDPGNIYDFGPLFNVKFSENINLNMISSIDGIKKINEKLRKNSVKKSRKLFGKPNTKTQSMANLESIKNSLISTSNLIENKKTENGSFKKEVNNKDNNINNNNQALLDNPSNNNSSQKKDENMSYFTRNLAEKLENLIRIKSDNESIPPLKTKSSPIKLKSLGTNLEKKINALSSMHSPSNYKFETIIKESRSTNAINSKILPSNSSVFTARTSKIDSLKRPEHLSYINYYAETCSNDTSTSPNLNYNIIQNKKENFKQENNNNNNNLRDSTSKPTYAQKIREANSVRHAILNDLSIFKKRSQNSNVSLTFRNASISKLQASQEISTINTDLTLNCTIEDKKRIEKCFADVPISQSDLKYSNLPSINKNKGSNFESSRKVTNPSRNKDKFRHLELDEEPLDVQELDRAASSLLNELSPLEKLMKSLDKNGEISNRIMDTTMN